MMFSWPLILALFVGWSLSTEKDFFIIKDLNMEVEFNPNQEAFLVALKPDLRNSLLSMKGQNIWTVGLSKVRKELLDHPWIAEVEFSRHFPDKIHSLIRLHAVAFLYVDKKNRIFPILENGDQLPQMEETLAPPAPVLRNNKIVQQPQLIKRVLGLYGEIPPMGALKKENIASVDFQKGKGLTLRLIKERALVHLGEEHIKTKALRVLRVTDYLRSQKQKARVIDARFRKKVLVRPRKPS